LYSKWIKQFSTYRTYNMIFFIAFPSTANGFPSA
jgi:hypothetical protein